MKEKKEEEEEGSRKCARGGLNRIRGLKEGKNPFPAGLYGPSAQFSM